MKKVLFTLLITFIGITSVFGQHDKREKLKAYKTAYITNVLDLSSKEAEKFWPIYNTYEKEHYQLKIVKIRKVRKKIKENGGIEVLSEKDANIIVQDLIKNEQAILNAKKELYSNLNNVISAKKILKLNKAENDFNRKLLMDYRKKQMRPNR